jgi:hypothetical protein
LPVKMDGQTMMLVNAPAAATGHQEWCRWGPGSPLPQEGSPHIFHPWILVHSAKCSRLPKGSPQRQRSHIMEGGDVVPALRHMDWRTLAASDFSDLFSHWARTSQTKASEQVAGMPLPETMAMTHLGASATSVQGRHGETLQLRPGGQHWRCWVGGCTIP